MRIDIGGVETRMMRPLAGTIMAALVMTCAWAQQPVEIGSVRRPAGAPPGAGVPADFNKSLEAQRPAWEAYQRCIRENERTFLLSSISRSLIDMRDGRERYIALLNDPRTPARFKEKSYDQSLAEGMAEYHRLGGTARSVEDITPLANPCADVQPGPKLPPNRGDLKNTSAVSAHAVVAAPSTQLQPTPAIAADAPRTATPPATARRGGDANACLKLSSDKEIMACAEKYR